jgi:hypothetical protein
MAGANPAILAAIKAAVLDPKLARETADAQAYTVVSLACASVVVDAAQYVQAVTVVSAAAVGAFTAGMVAQVVATGDPNSPLQFQTAIQDAQKNAQDAARTFTKIGEASSTVLGTWKGL